LGESILLLISVDYSNIKEKEKEKENIKKTIFFKFIKKKDKRRTKSNVTMNSCSILAAFFSITLRIINSGRFLLIQKVKHT